MGMTDKRILIVKGPGARVGCEGRGDLGVRFDRLNELKGEAGEVLELVERPGGGDEVRRPR